MKMLIKKCKHLMRVVNSQTQVLFSQQLKYRSTIKHAQLAHQQIHTTYSFTMVFGVISMMLLLLLPLKCVDAAGYSYTRFVGPVTGPERKIFVNDATNSGSGAPPFDYVAKPEYEFAYGVEDADAHILHNRNEMRDGDAVKGVYSLIDPDGTLRVVKYTADETNGFQAEVIRNGLSSLHGQLQHDYIHKPTSISNSYYKPNYKPHQYPESYAHFKEDIIADYPSSNIYKPNVVQLPQNKYETPPQLPIIHHYDKNYDDDKDGDNNGKSNENHNDDNEDNEDQQPQYEVHERPDEENPINLNNPPQYEVHEKPDEESEKNQDDNMDNKSKNQVKVATHKKKNQQVDEYDDDEGEDYDDCEDSEEVDDYDEAVHATQSSEESYEYY